MRSTSTPTAGPSTSRSASKTGFTLTASSITGVIENRFNRTRPSVGREGRGAELTLDTGNTSARITIRTFRGTIVVHH